VRPIAGEHQLFEQTGFEPATLWMELESSAEDEESQ